MMTSRGRRLSDRLGRWKWRRTVPLPWVRQGRGWYAWRGVGWLEIKCAHTSPQTGQYKCNCVAGATMVASPEPTRFSWGRRIVWEVIGCKDPRQRFPTGRGKGERGKRLQRSFQPPVEPNPPAPRSVSGSSAHSIQPGARKGMMRSWAMRSPRRSMNSCRLSLRRQTLISPR